MNNDNLGVMILVSVLGLLGKQVWDLAMRPRNAQNGKTRDDAVNQRLANIEGELKALRDTMHRVSDKVTELRTREEMGREDRRRRPDEGSDP